MPVLITIVLQPVGHSVSAPKGLRRLSHNTVSVYNNSVTHHTHPFLWIFDFPLSLLRLLFPPFPKNSNTASLYFRSTSSRTDYTSNGGTVASSTALCRVFFPSKDISTSIKRTYHADLKKADYRCKISTPYNAVLHGRAPMGCRPSRPGGHPWLVGLVLLRVWAPQGVCLEHPLGRDRDRPVRVVGL